MRACLRVVALLLVCLVTGTARADDKPWWANLPQIPLSPPTASDVGRFLKAAQACPPVEIAPGVFVPIPCASALPNPPGNAETLELPMPLFVPAAVDLRAQGLDGPTKDQGQTGVCFAFATTTVLENSLRRQGRGDVLSALHFVAEDGWSDLWRSAPREGIALEAAWPYDPVKACRFLDQHDSCEQTYGVPAGSWRSDPGLSAERDRAAHMAAAFAGRAKVLRNRPVDQIVAALASGRAVYASIDIDSVAWGYKGIANGVLAEYENADRGGHAVALVGYRTLGPSRQFLLHNSWGRDWGERGYAWITEASLRKHLKSAQIVDATAAVGAPARVSQACAAGTVLDVATGRCAARCPSGLAPILGTCWAG